MQTDYINLIETLYLCSLLFILGLVLGSFGNAWAWRICHGEKISHGRSHCPNCGHVLSAKDLVPLFSFIFLKGRCRYCSEKISLRYPASEAVMGIYFLSVYLTYAISLTTIRFLILGFILFVCSLTDLETMEIPDALLLAAAAVSLLRFFEGEGWKSCALSMLSGALAVSVPLLIIVLIADKVLKKESMGGGDIKMVAVLGLHFGAAKMLLLLIIACIIGLLAAYAMKKKKDAAFPFGPALALAGWITALFGQSIVNWYIGLL